MFCISRVSICLSFILSFSTLLSAQEQRGVDGPKLSPVITAATAGENVRFGSPAAGIAQIRVQIISATGDALFDSEWKDGNVLDWPTESLGQPLATGSYRCVVMVKDLDGQVTRKEAVLTAEGGQVSIEPRAGNEGLTMVEAGESGPKITMLAHDERNGAIVNTSGDLSFRFGEFFAGKDGERMRLTAEGSLGIGTDKPQAPLDVNGLIRTSKGIMFPDGTILTTAGGEAAATGPSGGANPLTRSAGGGAAPGSQTSATHRRLTPRPNAAAYQFVVDSAGVHVGTTSAYGLDVAGDVNLSSPSAAIGGSLRQGGSRLLHTFGPNNVFLGLNAGNFTMTGGGNTGIGFFALISNTGGGSNTASGAGALQNNTGGVSNTASGAGALLNNTNSNFSTAIGYQALLSSTGGRNMGIGSSAGSNLTTGFDNICIGNNGVAAESYTTRIGAFQTRAFIAGIRGVTTGAADAVPVVIDSTGQLGTVSSSARFKEGIEEMGETSSVLLKLRPVTFRYKGQAGGRKQFGLIAEEVEEVLPELVVHNSAGEVETVLYHEMPAMLLNELQKQDRRIEEQQKTIDALNTTLDVLGQRLQALERQVAIRPD